MADPKITFASVEINYRADDGYRSGTKMKSLKDVGKPTDVLLEALEELARLTSLFGLEIEAAQRFHDARVRVADWRMEQRRKEATSDDLRYGDLCPRCNAASGIDPCPRAGDACPIARDVLPANYNKPRTTCRP